MKPIIKKVHAGKDLAISTIILIAAVGLFFVNKASGICIAALAFFMLLFYKSGYKINGEKTVFTKKSADLCKECKSALMDFLNGKDTTPIIKEGNEGGCIRVDVYFSKAESKAFIQVFDFCNYEYKEATELIELNGQRAEKIIAQL